MTIDRITKVISTSKRPGASDVFGIDWSTVLADGVGVASSSWAVPAGITGDNDSVSSNIAYIRLTGGTAGVYYDVVNTITTTASPPQTLVRTLRVLVSGTQATLVETPGLATSNTYASLAEATAYLDTEMYVDAWYSATEHWQSVALIKATRMLDDYVSWNGVASNASTQALRWPRTGVVSTDLEELDSATIPDFLKRATSLLAAELLTENIEAARDSVGLSSMAIPGAVSLTFDRTDKKPVISDRVRQIIGTYGKVKGHGSTVSVVRT